MCEPAHSIVQYPLDDTPSGGNGTTESRLQLSLGKIYQWGKRIGKFLNLSCFGSGHHESIAWATKSMDFSPPDIKYEVNWWERTTHIDGGFTHAMPGYFDGCFDRVDLRSRALKAFKEESAAAAHEYAMQSSIGNLTQLRNFLETGMHRSIYAYNYAGMFRYMLLPKGRTEFYAKFVALFGYSPGLDRRMTMSRQEKANLPRVIKFVLGYTRKRNLLVPEWADDAKLWLPGKELTA